MLQELKNTQEWKKKSTRRTLFSERAAASKKLNPKVTDKSTKTQSQVKKIYKHLNCTNNETRIFLLQGL
jgi:hypothetical protein